MKTNLVGWFEIPVSDMDRAVQFYQAVFEVNVNVEKFGPMLMGWFPHDEKMFGAGGALVFHEEFYQPSIKGTLVYFNSKDVAIEIDKIKNAGGQVIQDKTLISEEIGYMALFIDSEGNRLALHSQK